MIRTFVALDMRVSAIETTLPFACCSRTRAVPAFMYVAAFKRSFKSYVGLTARSTIENTIEHEIRAQLERLTEGSGTA
ncbi:MAG: hypothetical protein M3R40_11035 [Pseudomonadota bacterium]|nr:hypothetical protein [Pseudomonadota bacterium]